MIPRLPRFHLSYYKNMLHIFHEASAISVLQHSSQKGAHGGSLFFG